MSAESMCVGALATLRMGCNCVTTTEDVCASGPFGRTVETGGASRIK